MAGVILMLIAAPLFGQVSLTYVQQGNGPRSFYRVVARNMDILAPAQVSGATIEEQAALNGIEPLQMDLQTPWVIARETTTEIGRIAGPSGAAAAFIAKGPAWAKAASLAVTALVVFLPRLLRDDTPLVDPAAPPIAIPAGGGTVRQMRGYTPGGKVAPVHVVLPVLSIMRGETVSDGAHNPVFAGSIPAPATSSAREETNLGGGLGRAIDLPAPSFELPRDAWLEVI